VEQGGASASRASMNEMRRVGERSLARHRVGPRVRCIQDSIGICPAASKEDFDAVQKGAIYGYCNQGKSLCHQDRQSVPA